MELYQYIDFVGTESTIAKLSDEEYKRLGKVLDSILELARTKLKRAMKNRFRFEKFNSVDDFALISDDKIHDVARTNIKKTPKLTRVLYNSESEKQVHVEYGNIIKDYKI